MLINYSETAFESLIAVVNFVESNTPGAGIRWLKKFENYLLKSLRYYSLIKACNNQAFHDIGLRCINYKNWVFSFSINEEGVTIEGLLHFSRLID